MQLILIFSLLALVVIGNGCGSSLETTKYTHRIELADDNLQLLAGCYAYVGQSLRYIDISQPIFNEKLLGTLGDCVLPFDTVRREPTTFCLEVDSNKNILATAYLYGTPVGRRLFSGHVNGDGYFRISGYYDFSGIPPFYWSTESWAAQLGLDSTSTLYIDIAYDRSGGSFILLGGNGYSHKDTYYFKPIDNKN